MRRAGQRALLFFLLFAHFYLRTILSDLPSPAEAGFAKAGNRFPLFGIMRYRGGAEILDSNSIGISPRA